MPEDKISIGSVISDSYKQYSSLSPSSRLKFSGAVGGVAGFIKSRQDDAGLGESILDTALGVGVSMGGSSVVDYIVKNHGDQIKEILSPTKEVTVGEVAKKSLEVDTRLSADEVAARAAKGVRIGAKGIAGLIAVGTMMSISNSLQKDVRTERMKRDEEQQLVRKERENQRNQRDLFGYNKPTDFGQLVLDMWDDRIGHHKMGNAKFQ